LQGLKLKVQSHVYLTFDDLKEHRYNESQQNPLGAGVSAFASFDVPIKKMPQVVTYISGIPMHSEREYGKN
jgi:hypothetical protein